MRGLGLAGALLLLAGCYQPAAPLPTWAPPPTAQPAPAGCEALVQLTLARHPALEAARRGEAVARAEAEVLVPSPFPDVRLRDDLRGLGDDLRVGLRWALPRPGVADAADAAGEAGVQLSQAELALAEAQVAAAVRTAHWRWRHARAAAQGSARLAERAEAERAFVARKRAAGLASAVATTRADLAHQVAQAAAAEAQARARAAEQVLARFSDGELPGEAACAPPTQAAVDDHPQVRAARAVAAQREAKAEVDRRQAWPWLGYFELLYDREPDQADRVLAGLSFDVGKPFETDRTQAVRDRAVAQLAATRRAVADAVAQAQADLEAAEATVAALPRGEAAAGLLSQAQAAGADLTERLALRRALDALALRRQQATLAVEAARIRLARSLGQR